MLHLKILILPQWAEAFHAQADQLSIVPVDLEACCCLSVSDLSEQAQQPGSAVGMTSEANFVSYHGSAWIILMHMHEGDLCCSDNSRGHKVYLMTHFTRFTNVPMLKSAFSITPEEQEQVCGALSMKAC